MEARVAVSRTHAFRTPGAAVEEVFFFSLFTTTRRIPQFQKRNLNKVSHLWMLWGTNGRRLSKKRNEFAKVPSFFLRIFEDFRQHLMDLLPDLERDTQFCQMTDHAPRCLPERDRRQKEKKEMRPDNARRKFFSENR